MEICRYAAPDSNNKVCGEGSRKARYTEANTTGAQPDKRSNFEAGFSA